MEEENLINESGELVNKNFNEEVSVEELDRKVTTRTEVNIDLDKIEEELYPVERSKSGITKEIIEELPKGLDKVMKSKIKPYK